MNKGGGQMKKASEISVSMMCVDVAHTREMVRLMEENGVSYFHIDIMDGEFVPNFCLGTDYIRQLRTISKIPMDIHLMIENPDRKLDYFDIRPGDFVSVHCETTQHLQRTLQYIRSKGAKAMAALNPATPLEDLRYVLDDLDGILVMTVNPGFAGQKLVPATLQKIADVKAMLKETGHEDIRIEVDGNVSLTNAVRMRQAGADIFVAGTSGLIHGGIFTDEGFENFRKAID
jgi:ribulose-phosphate 3-epimerase